MKLPGLSGVVLSGSKVSPSPVYHVPCSTVTKRSSGCQCGRVIAPGENLARTTYTPGLLGSPCTTANLTPSYPGRSVHLTSSGVTRTKPASSLSALAVTANNTTDQKSTCL